MPSAAESQPPRDPGLASERTALAWQRMALGFTSMAAVMLAAAAHRQVPWLVAPSVALFAVAAAVWRYARRRTGDRGVRTARRPIALLAIATVAAAVAAAALSLVRPG
jgi:uncharacterized membrane protein YidH (DUF202 family)